MPDDPTTRALRRLRWLICIGEALAPDLCRKWLRFFPDVPLMNAYGPAECSDTVATYRVAAPPLATVPIGRAIANTRLYVLDAHLQPAPIGVAGELCVGGAGVAAAISTIRNRPGNASSATRSPRRRGARLYRTGDLARWCADGTLEFVGRVDHQVKMRGYRIELEEIEHVLVEHADVQAAVALARDDLGGESRLVAHIVAADRRQPAVNELRDFLKTRLPDYMVPTGFIFLDRIPLTAHGKVDRAALMAVRKEIKAADSDFVRHGTPPKKSWLVFSRTSLASRPSVSSIISSNWAVIRCRRAGCWPESPSLSGFRCRSGRCSKRLGRGTGPADRQGVREQAE